MRRQRPFDTLIDALKQIENDIENESDQWNEESAEELLKETKDQVVRVGAVQSGDLRDSFEKGNTNNIFDKRNGGKDIEVGSSLEYAAAVNDGHRTGSGFSTGRHFLDVAIQKQTMSGSITKKNFDKFLKDRFER